MLIAVWRFLVVSAFTLFSMSVATAHVTVWPKTSVLGTYEKYTVRVPTEGNIATTSIELEIPANATFISIGAAVGHTYELRKSDGRVVAIVWSMQINPGEFAEFAFIARNPKDGTELIWKAVQRFADGTSTQWNGAAGDKRPASITILGGGNSEHSH
ncbi:MAG TPA: DUF1775 domain-containing protein [Steroidobacteraceae bacterium]|jgi:uncharacterized protein YcnI